MKTFFLFVRGYFDRLRKLGAAGVLGLIWITMPALAGIFLILELGPISDWLEAQAGNGLLIYAAIFMVGSGLGLLPTTAQAVLGGWVFGAAWGLSAASVGFAGAALIGLLITRLVAGKRIERLIEQRPAARAIRNALIGKGWVRAMGMIALLRMPPQAPFAFTNLLMVSCGAAAVPFVLGTVIGMIPRTFVLMLFASAAAETGAHDIQSFLREGPGWPVAAGGIAAMVAVIALIGGISRSALRRLHVDPAELR